jgi:ribosome-binding factor A
MTKREMTTKQKRLESLYERELKIIVYQIVKKESLPFFPISCCRSSKKFQSIKVLVSLEDNKENKVFLGLFNNKYSRYITKCLALCKKFSRIPKITFDFDFELNELNKLEEIIKTI